MIVDAHTHVWPRWPYEPPVPDDETRGSYENLLFQLDAAGVDRAVLVNARITRSEDNNDYGARAVREHPDRFFHVVDLDGRWGPDYHQPGAAGRLRALVDTYRPVGVSHYLAAQNDGWLRSPEGTAFFEVAAEHSLLVNFAAPPVWMPDLREVARSFPTVPLLVNHLGVVGLHPAGIDEALELVLDGGDLPNLLVKVSGYYYGAERPWDFPYADRMQIVRAFYESWGPARMIWASDWPSVLPHMSYRQSLEILREHADFLDPSDLDLILGDTLADILTARGRM
ncbi:MAG TPA: amidohydrolase family protein [Galbitalea sp.]|nr:amidohydrolase family protein [Galbitalea sp.]